MERADITIIGAGVIGLAVAAGVAGKDKNTVVVERHDTFGQETSSRNSEVIHAGIHYKRGSLKARLCVEGRQLLYSFCNEHNISHKRLGKLIVAADAREERILQELLAQARDNGVEDLKFFSGSEVQAMEPDISAVSALYSPSTGILDTHQFMKRLESLAKERGALFAYNCEVAAVDKQRSGYCLDIRDADGERTQLLSRIIINCAGLCSDGIAEAVGIDIEKAGYRLHYCKGEYFRVRGSKAKLVKHLIYPKPESESLGIHTVLDLSGQMRLGPNAFYVNDINYDVDISHSGQFCEAAKRYLPFIEEEDLTPDISGIRPKLQAPDEGFADFVISDEKDAGLEGLIDLVGIESPGFTASLAIAKYVDSMIDSMV